MVKLDFWFTIVSFALSGSFVHGSSTVNTYSHERCFTRLTATKPSGTVPTSTFALTIPLPKQTVTTTSTPISTWTPATSTSVSVTTVFTTTVVTSTPAAVTIPASAGFVPLASDAAAAGYSPNYKRDVTNLKNRGVEHNARAAVGKGCTARVSNGKVVVSPTQYPKAVFCYKLAKVVTVTTVTKTASSTITVTAATPVTTSISTSTSTVTSTTIAPAPSPVYAACQADNMLSHISGDSVDGIGNFQNGLSVVGAGSAYDCCLACVQADSTCGGYAYFGGNTCFLSTITTCDASAQVGFVSVDGQDDGVWVVAGNSNCGRLTIDA